MKPLGKKAYGSIPHLPGSRLGETDSHIHEGQARILTEKTRDKHDTIIVTEKLDGSNCAVAKIDNTIYPLTRAGYIAETSPFIQHHYFQKWVEKNIHLFDSILDNGEWVSGEWMIQAHGTIYDTQNPFYVFDLFRNKERVLFSELRERIADKLPMSVVIHEENNPIDIWEVDQRLGTCGYHAADYCEGAVWRCERKGKVDFLAKYVRLDKEDGAYMNVLPPIWNFDPAKL